MKLSAYRELPLGPTEVGPNDKKYMGINIWWIDMRIKNRNIDDGHIISKVEYILNHQQKKFNKYIDKYYTFIDSKCKNNN